MCRGALGLRGTRLSGRVGPGLYYLRILPWYAWPLWPLAIWALWRAFGNGPVKPGITLPLAVAGFGSNLGAALGAPGLSLGLPASITLVTLTGAIVLIDVLRRRESVLLGNLEPMVRLGMIAVLEEDGVFVLRRRASTTRSATSSTSRTRTIHTTSPTANKSR